VLGKLKTIQAINDLKYTIVKLKQLHILNYRVGVKMRWFRVSCMWLCTMYSN